MINVLIVTHGPVGQQLLTGAESIVGRQTGVRALGLDPAEGLEAFKIKIQVALEEMSTTAGVLVLSDMLGGTPTNAALRLAGNPKAHFDVVTGIHLPMLITALTHRHYMPLDQLAQKLLDDTSRHVARPLVQLRAHHPEEK